MSKLNLDSPLKELFDKLENKAPIYRIIAGRMHHAVEENFRTEGHRVGGWQRLKRSTLRNKRRRGGSKKRLQFRGNLVKSIQEKSTNDFAAVGTNLIYAKTHQEGRIINMAARSELFKRLRYKRGSKKGKFKKGTSYGRGYTRKKHTIKIPARPFLKLNKDDFQDIKNIIKEYLTR